VCLNPDKDSLICDMVLVWLSHRNNIASLRLSATSRCILCPLLVGSVSADFLGTILDFILIVFGLAFFILVFLYIFSLADFGVLSERALSICFMLSSSSCPEAEI